MIKTRLFVALAAVFAIASAGVKSVAAQGVTTGAIAGTVTDENGAGVANAQVQITNRSTGFSTGGLTREGGNYIVQGLETGGPYSMTVRRIGYQPSTRDNLIIGLSATTRVDIRLTQQAAQLSGVVVSATASTSDMTPSNMGTKTTVSDTVIQRLPTTSRNLTDFIKLTPQVSSSGPGFSGGGMSNRMNNVQIDGATERDVFGLGSTGQPGGQIGAKAISIDAVKEFQVLLAPFDVRQGNFGGLLLNAITKSGTNTWSGTAFRYYRDQDYGRNVPVLRATQFKRDQYGFSLGGPIIKDRLHFFTANEWQRESTPVTGPFRGQPAGTTPAFPFSEDELNRFEAAYTAKGGNAGSAGILNAGAPMDNLFGRLDFQINDVHRLVARFNYTDATDEGRRQNSRTSTRAIYTSNMHQINSKKKAPVFQLFSNFKNGWSNEAFAGASIVRDRRIPGDAFPQITVNYSGGRSIIAGADEFSQGNELDVDTYEFTDNLTLPFGAHSIVVGTRNEFTKLRNLFAQSSLGAWNFADIAGFESGAAPTGMRKNLLKRDGGNAYFDALQTALYAQDQWTVSPKLTLTLGLRADISNFLTDHAFSPAVDSAYGKQTVPGGALQWSPRFGFNWDATGDQMNQVRGGIGLFVGTPPYVWLENAYVNNGLVQAILDCGSARGVPDPAPAFTVNVASIQACANGRGANPVGLISFVDKDLKFPQPLRANLAYDHVLGASNVVATIEGLYSRTLNQLFFVNSNLAAPTTKDKFGRVLYGTIATTGIATATRPPAVVANGGAARFPQAINLKNQNEDYAYNITAQLRKRYSDNWEALVAYTFGRARDVQSFTSSTHSSNWAFGRTLSGRQEDAFTGVSLFDQPHKLVAFYTRSFNWAEKLGSWGSKLSTDLTVSYQGVSGAPFDYVYGGSSGRGDMNADGQQGNDLLYVPLNANDPNEIRFASLTTGGRTLTPAQQAAALEQLISITPCMRDNRGKILARNSCRLPFSNTFDVQLRQSIPTIMDQRLSIMLDIFNFGNMVNKNWGQQRVNPLGSFNNINLVTHTASSSADATTAVPTVQFNYTTFDPTNSGTLQPTQAGNFASNFWRMQLAARYSF